MTTPYWHDFYGTAKRRTNAFGTPGKVYSNGYHRGEDIAAYGQVADIPALRAGAIIDSGRSNMIGHWVCIKPDEAPDRRDIYCHVYEPTSKKSGRVEAGTIIGRTADAKEKPGTGWNGPHLHLVISTLSDGGHVVSRPAYDPRPVIAACLSRANKPAPAPATSAPAAGQRRVKRQVNRRIGSPTTSAPTGAPLTVGTIGNFVGYIRGENVGGINIWLKGISGDFFHSGNFEGSYVGLPDLGTWNAPAAPNPAPVPVSAPAKRAHVRLGEPWHVYTSEHAAYHNIIAERRGLAPAGDHLITDFGNSGKPVQIQLGGVEGVRTAGRYWVGGRYTAAPVVHI